MTSKERFLASPPLDAVDRLVRKRLAEDVAAPTVQVNVYMTASEAARVSRLADETGWTKRRVVAVATEVLEAALRESAISQRFEAVMNNDNTGQ